MVINNALKPLYLDTFVLNRANLSSRVAREYHPTADAARYYREVPPSSIPAEHIRYYLRVLGRASRVYSAFGRGDRPLGAGRGRCVSSPPHAAALVDTYLAEEYAPDTV